jgi:lysophospholipase I
MATPGMNGVPIFVGHGSQDPLVKVDFATATVDYLETKLGFAVKRNPESQEAKGVVYNIYGGIGHTTNEQELDDLRGWLKEAIPKTDE